MIGLVSYLLAGYLLVPVVVESELVSLVEAKLGVRPQVGRISFDPFGLRLTLHGFELPDAKNSEPVLTFEELVVDLLLLGFLEADVVLEEVLLVAPRLSAAVDESGELNLRALFPPDDATEDSDVSADEAGHSSDGPLIVDIDSIRIERGDVLFVDRSQAPAFEVRVAPLDLEVEAFTTRAGGSSPYSLLIRVGNATELHWSGTIGLDPIHSEGEISLAGFVDQPDRAPLVQYERRLDAPAGSHPRSEGVARSRRLQYSAPADRRARVAVPGE